MLLLRALGWWFRDAIAWFEAREASLDEETFELWDRARLRCRLRAVLQPIDVPMWSSVA